MSGVFLEDLLAAIAERGRSLLDLGNGARLKRINWLGDRSHKGLREAAGPMVNYLYAIPGIEKKHEAYASRRQAVAAPGVTKLSSVRL